MRNRTILPIDGMHQVERHEILHQLLLIGDLAPLAGFSAASIPIWKSYDQWQDRSIPDQCISRLRCVATLDPVVLATRRTMQQVERGEAQEGYLHKMAAGKSGTNGVARAMPD